MKKNILTLLALSAGICSYGQYDSFLITGIAVHTATDRVIEDAALGVTNGLITYVGSRLNAPLQKYENVYEKRGLIAYPGLIAANTTLGLNEITAVRATRDYSEAGTMNPNVRALIAFNAESDVAATVLANGVLLAQVCPRGGVISGTSSVMALHGWNWEDAAYRIDDGLHMTWPNMFKAVGKDDDDPQGFEFDEKYQDKILEIKSFFSKAKAYASRKEPLERDLRLEGARGIFDSTKTLYVRADFVKQIREAIAFKREMGIPKMVIVGGYDSWMVTDLLKENNISVLVRRVNSLPRFAEDPLDAGYGLPAKLAQSGVLFALEMDGDMETMQNRNLPFNAGTAIGYGLSENEALKACTIYTARILGIDQRTGSLEVGKEANFVLTNGSIFEIRESTVREIYFRGQPVIPANKQDTLYEKYRSRYRQ